MKQMTLIEMDGFLKGKCIPSDLKVNETNAEYLVRKFAEAQAKCALAMIQVVMLPMRLLNWCGDWSWLKVVRSRGSWMMVLAWC